jgi:hypothetical protein
LNATAVVLAVWAVAATLNTALSSFRQREILNRKKEDLQRIRRLADRWAVEEAWQARLEALKAWTPARLEAMADGSLGEGAARVSVRPAVPAAGEWQVREAVVEIREVPYEALSRFLGGVSEAPPAWRLRAVELRPSAEAGKGDAILTFEALEKKQP